MKTLSIVNNDIKVIKIKYIYFVSKMYDTFKTGQVYSHYIGYHYFLFYTL